MSTTDKLQTIALVVTSIGVLAAVFFSWRVDRLQRRAEARIQAAQDWDEAVANYADEVVTGLAVHAHSGDMYPEYPVPKAQRTLAHAAVQRGLLSRGTVSGHVTLPGRESTPSVSGVGLYGGIFRS